MNKPTAPSDSVADAIENSTKCPQCGAVTRLDHGTCINCLLHEGLEAKGQASREAFESVLVEDDVTDAHWRLGHYEILEEIGRGGMGVIYRARQQHSRRIVAVKRIFAHEANSHETLTRFRREAEAVASLDHLNILPIHEVSESEEGLPFFSMKYATGGSLRSAAPTLRKNPRGCVQLMAKVARAIDYAHGKGILHRDLQPGNILLDENGEPMVSDFGLAKWLDQSSDLTKTLETLGTPGYIAPEQTECPANKLTPAADIYSLGAILFYLLTGRPPFVGSNVLHVIHQAAATPAPRLRSLAPSLDRDVETIVGRCLESDPRARYQSGGALAEDLEHWLRHEPIQARRSGVFTRAGKWVRRNPTTTMLITALVGFAAAIVGVMVWKNESLHPIPSLPAGIAVLPLQNLSEEKENAYFADGIQDELLTNLSKIRDLKVISRTSVMQYKTGITRNLKEIAQQLGISNVVEGSVRRSANRVRVSVQLIDANTDRHVWAQNYDRALADSLSLQGDLATEIAAALGATLSPQEKARVQAKPTKNTAAYNAYLRGRAFSARSYQKSYEDNAIQSYQEAVKLDPSFALAWARLSIAIGHDPWDPSPARLASVKDAADHALALDPNLPETHLAVGYYRYGQHDYSGALSEFQQAEQGLPNNAEVIEAIALVQRRLGHWEEAITGLRRTIELDPRYHDAYENLAGTYRWLRRFPETLTTVDQLLAWEPHDPIALGRKAAAFWAMGDMHAVEPLLTNPGFDLYDRGVQALFQRRYAAAIEIFSAPPPLNLAPSPSTSERQLFLGLSQQRAGDVAAARATYQKAAQDFQRQLEKVVPGSWHEAWLRTCLGRAHAGLGDTASAIAEGQKAMAIDPTSKNPVDGPVREEKMANIYALLGDADHAIPILKRLLQITYAGAITPALLRLDPVWDQIRDDPRFQELAVEGKPIPEKGIAVLPFENLSADPENAFFADGVQDEVLNNLAKIADLKVISRTSVMQYKSGAKRNLRQISNELGVAHVVEGSVQRAANRVRVSAQLIDARTETHLWAERYDRPVDDVFAIQSEIAQAIADALRVKLSPSQSSALAAAPTRDTEAYDLFLKGEYEERQAESTYKGETYDRAAAFYRQALTRDPSFALAYARHAYNRIFRHWYVKRMTPTQLEEVKSDIERALAIAPDLPEAHLALGLFHYWGRHDFDPAVREFDRAIELQPSNSVSREFRAAIYRRRGEWRRSLAEFERGMELDPRDVWKADNIGSGYLALRRWRDAEHWLKHALALDPHHLGAAYRLHLTYLASTGDIQRARQAWEGIPVQKATTTVGAYEIVIPQMIDDRVYLDVLERNFPKALKEWNVAPANTDEARLVQLKARIGIQVLAGQNAAAKRECQEARALLEAELAKRQPGDRTSWSEVAWIYVCLGRNADALRVAREAAESMPIEKDAVLGVNFLVGLAQIEAHTGQSEEAIKILRHLLTIPAGEYISVARLKIDPVWDPIRNDPGFQKLLSEPEPETIYK
jgi:TolB-like protein/Flp pilus assembly protein TadD/tRNA A-37 threonylcarbamoyl transferase component Bud32